MSEDKESVILEKHKARLEQEVKELEGKQRNLETQLQDMAVRLESEKRFVEVETKNKYARREIELKTLENTLKDRDDALERKAAALKEREQGIERHELQMGDINIKRLDLVRDQNDFLNYKDQVEKELSRAKEHIAEVNAKWEALKIEKDRLMGVETNLKKREELVDRELGIMTQAKKEFNQYKKNVLDPKGAVKVEVKEEAHVQS